ncbi:MAG: beta strand repeat-containing protein [Thermoanaerobaculia bacterium]
MNKAAWRAALLLCSSILLAHAAGAATVTLQAFLDTDYNASTGCAISTSVGTFSGAEYVLTTTVDTTAGEVTGVELQSCSGGVLGAPFAVTSPYSPPWPIGFGSGVSGSALIESYVPLSALSGAGLIRAGFVSTDQVGEQDGILQGSLLVSAPGSTPATGIPTLSQWGFLALTLLLGLAALIVLKRGAGGSLLVILIVVLLGAGVAWAAITLTGNPADWSGVAPVATQAPGANPTHADLYAVYAVSDGTSLFFRFDVKLCPIITVSPTSLSDGTINAAYPSTTFTQSGGVGAIAWSESGALPSGMTFSGGGTLSGTPSQTGAFPITFTATDSNGCTGSQAITLTINACPVITVTNPATNTGTAGVAFSQTFTQSGGVGTITWSETGALPSGITLDSATGVLSGTTHQAGSFPITVKATDTNGCIGSSTYTLTIACQTITVTNPGVNSGTVDAAFSQTFTDSGILDTATWSETGALPSGITLNSATGVLSGTPTVNGSFPITVKATDSNGCFGTSSYTLTIACPTISVTDPATTTGTVDAAFSQTFTQSGAHGTATFTLATGSLPAGLTLSTGGVLSGTPTQTGSFPIVVTVTDSNGCTGTGATYTLTISCQTITVTDPATTTGTANTAFSQTFTQSGAHGTATFTTSSTPPAGLTLSTAGVLSGTPTQTGSFPIVVTVTDANGCTGTGATYTLVIGCQIITVTNPAETAGTINAAFSQTFTQTNAIGSATFTTASTLPAGLTLATDGTLSGTPTELGSFPIVVTVTDSNGCTGTGSTYTLVIGCQQITVEPSSLPSGTSGAAYSPITFTQTGGVGTITWSETGSLPTGSLSLDPSTGVLAGTPTQAGSFPITVAATDANGCTGSRDYVLVVSCVGATITVSPTSLPQATSGTAFTATFTGSGGAVSYTFMQSGTLPAGLNFLTDTISGTPTQTGEFPITIVATDTNGCQGSRDYLLVVSCSGVTITVTPATLSDGLINTAYSAVTFGASGGTGSYTFSQTGVLPAGMTYSSGTLSGTPTQSGAFPITVAATDAAGCAGSRAYTLTIDEPPAITSANSKQFPPSVFTSFTVTTTGFPTGASMVISESGSLPTGLTFVDNHDGTATISGTPSGTSSFPIVITASNGIAPDATQNFTIQLCPVITVTNPATNTGTAGTAFSQTFTQSGGNGTISWSESGSLPTGIALNTSTGVLSGTTHQVGSFPITVTATDQDGCQGSGASYTLTISCQTVGVTNPGVNTGTVDAAFSQTFTDSGILDTATWSETGALPSGVTLNPSTGVLSGTPTVNGSFPITVKATDTNGCFGTGTTYTLTIACQTINVTNPATTTGTVDAAFSQTFTQSGAHGTATFTTASTLPSGLTLSTAGVLSGTPTVKGSFPIVVTVTDANGCTGTGSTYTLTIACQTITVTKPATTTGTVDAAFSQTFTQSGAHGTATFTTASTLPVGLTLSTAGVLSGTPTQSGSFPIVVTVTDSNGCTGSSSTYTLVIACNVISVTNPVNAAGTVNAAFSEQFTQSGGVGTITWSKSGALPTGITLNASTGVLSGTPTVKGTFPITVTATDSNGCQGTGATYTLVVACQTITVGPSSIPSGTSGVAYSSTFTQAGGVGTITWSETGSLPTGTLALNPSTGVLSGTPTQTGTFPITVTATDANGCTGSHSYLLVIACSGTAITLSPGSLPTVTVNTAYAGTTFTAVGGTGTYTFAEAGALPAGMTFVAPTLSGTPTETGSFPITVSATDGNNCAGSQDYLLVVTCNGTTVTVGPASLTSGTVAVAYTPVTFTGSGGTGSYTFVEAGALPTGMTFDVPTETLSGTPTKSGTFPITVSATDANGCAGETAYSLVIVCQAINVTNPATNTGTAGTAFNQTFTQSGGNGTITWSESGTLPTGMTFHTTTGVLDGTPSQTGSFPITVTATDANGCQGTGASYSLTIVCPTITVARNGGGSFPQGSYNAAYAGQSVVASGGSGTYTYAVTLGALPTGLSLGTNGAITGTSTTATGVFNFTVTATDSNTSCTGSQALSISVGAAVVNDVYAASGGNAGTTDSVGNTQSVAAAFSTPATPFASYANSVLANDSSNAVMTVSTSSVTNAAGTITFNTSGGWSYVPAVNFTGTATFAFNVVTSGVTTASQVQIAVSSKVWYVDNSGSNGDGRSNTPFNTLAGASTASATGEIIYVNTGSGTTGQAAGITLKANQQLIGQGVALVVNGNTLAAAGTKPQITNTTATSDAVTLNDGNTIKGVTITGATRDGISSVVTHAGLTVDTVTVQSNTNVGVDLISMTGTVTITNSSISTAGNQAMTVNNGTAAVTVNNTNTLAGGTGTAFSVINRPASAGAIAVGATITGSAIQLLSNTSGTISFTGSQTLSSATVNAITMTTNTGATISFSGTLSVTTTTGVPFQASGGGTLNVTGTANLTSGAATNGLSINGMTIGGSGVTFTSVSTTGATTGINLVNFAAAGTVSVNGGTISNGTTGISLQGTNTSLTLAGVTITGPATGITNTTNFGTLTIGSSVNVSAAAALNLTTGTMTGTFANISGTGGTNGINLTSIGGTSGASAGSLAGASGAEFLVSGGGGSFSYAGSITQNTAGQRAVDIQNKSGGTIALSGAIGGAVFLNSNTGATINFTGAITASTGSSDAFTATGGGTVSATNTTSTLTTTSGTALNVANTTIGAGNLTFQSISSNGGNNGIILNNTGASGNLQVLGTGAAGTGGTIQHETGAEGSPVEAATLGVGIFLKSTMNPSLNWMSLHDFSNYAIVGTDVAGFTLTHTTVSGTNGTGTNAHGGVGEGDVYFTRLTGSATVDNCTFSGAAYDTFHVFNNTSQSLNRFTMTNSTLGATDTAGNDGLVFQATGGTLNVTVQDTHFTGERGDAFQMDLHGTMSSDLIFGGVGHGNTLTNAMSTANSLGADVNVGGGNVGDNVTFTFNISNNSINGAIQSAIAVGLGTGTHNTTGTINGNTVGTVGVAESGSFGGSAIAWTHSGGSGHSIATITNNQVHQYNNEGVNLTFGGFGTAGADLTATVTGNAISDHGLNASQGFLFTAGTAGTPNPQDTGAACLTLTGNTFTNSFGPGASTDIRIRERFDVKVGLPGYGGPSGSGSGTQVQTFVSGNNSAATASVPDPSLGTNNGTSNGFFGSCPSGT